MSVTYRTTVSRPGVRWLQRRRLGKVHYARRGKPVCGARWRHGLTLTGDARDVTCQRCWRWLTSQDKRQTTLALTLLLCSLGCAAPVGEPPDFAVQDRAAVEATIDVWARNTLPYSARCVSERLELHVLAVPQRQLDRCRLLEVGRGAIRGCYVSHVQSIWVPDDADPSLRADVVVHETLHWLHECNWGHTDHLHTGLLPSTRAGRAVDVWATESTRSLEMQAWAQLETR